MNTSPADTALAEAQSVVVSDESVTVELTDGRTLSVPISWYPRILHATTDERNHWELLGNGIGIHWPELDEDISVQGLLAGRRSGESAKSLEKWLAARARRTA